MNRRWSLLALVALGGFAHAGSRGRPLVEVWPYQAKTLADGAVEYAYDLVPVKKTKGTPDAIAANGEEAVTDFLKGLPSELKVRVAPGTAWTLSAGRGPEARPLSTAFALIPDGPMASDAALPKDPLARLRPPLHPETPKVMVGAAALATLLRQFEDGVVAAAELETEPLRRELFTKVMDRALGRTRSGEADAKEGAQALAARIGAALSCLDVARLPASVRNDAAVAKRAEEDVKHLAALPDAFAAPPPYSWSGELTCVFVRQRALAEPFEVSRAGAVATLTLLDLLAADPKLQASWDALATRQARVFGAPAHARLATWREATKGKPADAIGNLSEFLEGLPLAERTPPGPWVLPSPPIRQFLWALKAQERATEVDELTAGAQDGRLAKAFVADDWSSARDAALAALAASDGDKAVQLDGSWKDQLEQDLAVALGAHHEGRANGHDLLPDDEERTQLAVRLMVPPALDVEPAPLVYGKAHAALTKLGQVLTQEKLGGVHALAPDGSRSPDAATAEASRLAAAFRGLERLGSPAGSRTADEDLAAARRLIAGWRNDARLTRDVRSSSASLVAEQGQRSHWAIAGVSRRELVVGFAARPKVELLTPMKGVELFTDAEQRYVVPVAVTVQGRAPAAKKPLERAAVKSAFDGVGRDPTRIEGAFTDALAR